MNFPGEELGQLEETCAMDLVCEMIDVSPGVDGLGQESPCTTAAIGSTEDGTRLCERHGRAAVLEDITVIWDRAP